MKKSRKDLFKEFFLSEEVTNAPQHFVQDFNSVLKETGSIKIATRTIAANAIGALFIGLGILSVIIIDPDSM